MNPSAGYKYWSDTRRPLTSLVFLLPWMTAYEWGAVFFASATPDGVRNGVDNWLRAALPPTSVGQTLLLPSFVLAVMLIWHVVHCDSWRLHPGTQVGMIGESLLLAVALVAVGQLHQLLFVSFPETLRVPQLMAVGTPALPQAVSCIGAGVYEEVLFRLLLLPAAFLLLRKVGCSATWAASVSSVVTALLFALAHHVGPAADTFELFTFSFRTAAGVFFAGIFFIRGFGITVGCHAVYDLLVGVLLVTENG